MKDSGELDPDLTVLQETGKGTGARTDLSIGRREWKIEGRGCRIGKDESEDQESQDLHLKAVLQEAGSRRNPYHLAEQEAPLWMWTRKLKN